MKKSAPCAECVFEHTLKMTPRSRKNCIHNSVAERLFRPLDGHLPFRG
jgi:hypothetical protein